MGNNQLQVSSSTFALSGTIQHPHLGSINSTQSCEEFLKVYHFSDHMMGEQKLRRINARIKKFPNSDYLLNFKKGQLITKQEMCANNSDVYLYFQRYSQSLGSILSQRIKEKKIFTEKEVYEFLHHVLQALIFLQDNGFKNCHLDTQSVVMSQNKIKLIDLAIATNNPFQTFLEKLEPIPGFYVAPEMLKELKQKNYEPYISPKSDVFCLGMLTLELCCMEKLDNYYDLSNFSIDYESLIHRVSRIGYSTELKTILAGMLEYQPDQRFGMISCQEQVKKNMKFDSLQSSRNKQNLRSRSSSTKMLKDLLTNSRKTMKSSSQTQKSFSNRKQSLASLASHESIQNSQDRKETEKSRKYSNLYSSSNETSILKDLVKQKTSIIKESNQKFDSNNNKENYYLANTSFLNQRPSEKRVNISEAAYIMRTQTNPVKQTLNISTNDRFRKKTDMITPKEKYLQRIQKSKKEESIFRMIEENLDLDWSKDNLGEEKINKIKPLYSPAVPSASPVQEKGSMGRDVEQLYHKTKTITDFTIATKSFQKPNKGKQKVFSINNETKESSVTLKIKKSLDNMYKTTQSITNSEQKSVKMLHNEYKKVQLPNGFFYEGEVNENGEFEGNGFLHNQNGEVIYSGSWVRGSYQGFGTLHNLNPQHIKVNMNNLNEYPKSWLKYEGEFSKGEWEGFGTIYFGYGERISGCMRNGQMNGYGCFYDRSNEMTSGVWVNNRLQSS